MLRPYTPTSHPDVEGSFDLVVKSYDLGKMSQYLHALEVGQSILVRGPVGNFKYVPNSVDHLICICAGTGITPMLQVCRSIVHNPKDKDTRIVLLFQNRTVDDIILRDEILAEVAASDGRLEVHFFLSRPPDGDTWNGPNNNKGYISKNFLISKLVDTGIRDSRCRVLVCGPGGFETASINLTVEVGFEDSIIKRM